MRHVFFLLEFFSGVDFSAGTKPPKKRAGGKRTGEDSDSDWEDEQDDLSEAGDEELEYDVISEMKEEEVKKEDPEDVKPAIKLDAEGFALAEELIKSKKRRREIVEAGFHRYVYFRHTQLWNTCFPDCFSTLE